MPATLRERLKDKGWKEEEIEHAISIMQSEGRKGTRTYFASTMNPILYWMTLIVAIFGNIVIAVVLVPFFLVLSWQLYVVIAVLAVAFGAMFNWLIHAIENVDPAHHIVAGVFIPAVAIITVFVMVNLANRLTTIFQSPIHQNPVAVSVFYVACFMVPYLVTKLSDLMRRIHPIAH